MSIDRPAFLSTSFVHSDTPHIIATIKLRKWHILVREGTRLHIDVERCLRSVLICWGSNLVYAEVKMRHGQNTFLRVVGSQRVFPGILDNDGRDFAAHRPAVNML